MTITIDAVGVPSDLHADDAGPFLELADVFNTVMVEDLGFDHLRWEPAEMLPAWQDETYRIHRGFLARDGVGRAVGALQFTGPQEEGATELEFDLLVRPEARPDGVERLLLDRLEVEARRLGRTALQTYSLHRVDTHDARLDSPTGFGWVPLDHYTRLYQDAGFTLLQADRNSTFDLTGSLDHVRRMLDEALAFAGDDYRLVSWTPPTPPELKESFAFVLSRMSTDVPTAGLTVTEETWDAARVDVRDDRIARSGMTASVVGIVHVPSGRIVAYNDLAVGADRTRPTSQWGTLVTREHRGRRLGTIVKCANILRWRELVPESPFISTFNAEENRPMLDVNETIGFEARAVGGAWQRTLM